MQMFILRLSLLLVVRWLKGNRHICLYEIDDWMYLNYLFRRWNQFDQLRSFLMIINQLEFNMILKK